ncbi:helix-turn-helix domain-containing protein [Paenibacillus sp. XY044]|uniref:helix-turn-helix domain-containing protein n=1 Tax=Paenibacillus sp. XY044 TaxID=2026089 RepID=UPI000B990DF5|nr:helix-turn-helix transcriptional regulator [Paenibacillus sp. XY044]OZB90093.1 hypothetical protein CJP46_35540 [Paenibacillus sp. XY044]
MKINEKIKEYINSNGLIMKVVAKRSGIGLQRFYRIVNGNSSMTVEDYEKICRDGLEVDPSIFFKKNISKIEKLKTA